MSILGCNEVCDGIDFKRGDHEEALVARTLKRDTSQGAKNLIEKYDSPYLISRVDIYRHFLAEEINESGKVDRANNMLKLSGLMRDVLGKDLQKREVRVEIKEILLRSKEVLESLEVPFSKKLTKLIENVDSSEKHILDFMSLAQGFKQGSHGPIVCALLKVADAVSYFRETEELQDLAEKSERFSKVLAGKNNAHNYTPDELENPKRNKVFIVGNSTSFNAHRFLFKSKDDQRIIEKLLRTVSVDRNKILRDGIQVRIFVENEEEKEKAQKWLEECELGLESKTDSGNISRDKERKDIVLMGKFEESPVEIQILTEKEHLKNESGVKIHKVYEWLQKFLIFARLFGGISELRFEKKIKELSKTLNINEGKIRERFSGHFYFNQKTKKYQSFDYDVRLLKSKFVPPQVEEGLIMYFVSESMGTSLSALSSDDWASVLDSADFPGKMREDKEGRKDLLSFLKSKKLPGFLIRSLEFFHQLYLEEKDEELSEEKIEGEKIEIPEALKKITTQEWQDLFSQFEIPDSIDLDILVEKKSPSMTIMQHEGDILISFLQKIGGNAFEVLQLVLEKKLQIERALR